MADTIQVVSWALERSCVFRTGPEWFLPDRTEVQLNVLQTVARSEAEHRIIDGVCLTSYGIEDPTIGSSLRIGGTEVPYTGFRVEDRLKNYGGLSEAERICGACDANIARQRSLKIAGCFGYLDLGPDSPELNKALWRVVKERRLKDRLRKLFPPTKPLWYGFWINSPLRHAENALLLELFEALSTDDEFRQSDVFHFRNALQAALAWDLPLHVSLAPLGHTDFGYCTIFPHCPRCKACAPFKRWQESCPTRRHKCRACGHKFIPNDHHSMAQDDEEETEAGKPPLEKLLGHEEYLQFLGRYLHHRGFSDPQIEKIVSRRRRTSASQ